MSRTNAIGYASRFGWRSVMLLPSTRRSLRVGFIFLLAIGTMIAVSAVRTLGAADQASSDLVSGLKWRSIGPFHGGRIAAVTGAIGQGQAGVFYVGLPAGGI